MVTLLVGGRGEIALVKGAGGGFSFVNALSPSTARSKAKRTHTAISVSGFALKSLCDAPCLDQRKYTHTHTHSYTNTLTEGIIKPYFYLSPTRTSYQTLNSLFPLSPSLYLSSVGWLSLHGERLAPLKSCSLLKNLPH